MKPTKIDPSQPGSRIVNSILAVTTLTEVPQAEEDIVDADIMGFIVMYVGYLTYVTLIHIILVALRWKWKPRK
jgi:hypothetical protein